MVGKYCGEVTIRRPGSVFDDSGLTVYFTIFFVSLLLLVNPAHLFADEKERQYLNQIDALINSEKKIEIKIDFTEPLTLISSSSNMGRDVLQIDLRLGNSGISRKPDSALKDNLEQLGWKTSNEIPLLKVALESMGSGSSRLYLYFADPVDVVKIDESDSSRSISVIAQRTKAEGSRVTKPEENEQRLFSAMEKAREAFRLGDYPTAINIYTALLEEPENRYSQDALELLGVARERNGQNAHANAEYEKYLSLYSKGAGAARVRQRLAGLVTATLVPKEKLRSTGKRSQTDEWEIYGSLGSLYQRVNSSGDGLASEISQSDLITGVDISARRSGDNSESEARLSTDYITDMLGDSDDNEAKIVYAYFDHKMDNGLSAKLGRQRHNPSGALYRFDGVVLSYSQSKNVKYNFVYGAPVDRSSDSFINKQKRFYGISTELGTFRDHWDYSFFLVNQDTDGVTDRQATGGEIRYFDQKKSFFTLVDYDLLFNELNTWMFVSNFNLSNRTTAYINLDYRFSPILTTSNALQGQTTDSIDELSKTMGDDQVRQLARDRTPRSTLIAMGGSTPLNEDLQLGVDLSVATISATDASGGVEATPATGNDYYYTLQFIQNGFFNDRDFGVLSFFYADGDNADTFAVTGSNRHLISQDFRMNGKLRVSHRKSNGISASRTTLEPGVRLEYRLADSFHLESELGIAFRHETSSGIDNDSQDYLLNLGARWDF